MAANPTYYRGDLERDLIDAALASIQRSGPASISLRSLARSVGVSHAAPTNHFGDKSGLFVAIAVEGFEALADAVTDIRTADTTTMAGDVTDTHTADASTIADAMTSAGDDVLRKLGLAYVRHALEHPAHFAVMWDIGLHGDAPAVARARDASFDLLLSAVTSVESSDPVAVIERAIRAWIVAHGWATLLLSGSLIPPDGVDVLDYVRSQLRHFSIDGPP